MEFEQREERKVFRFYFSELKDNVILNYTINDRGLNFIAPEHRGDDR